MCDLRDCAAPAEGSSLTPALITHHCWQRKGVRFGVRQRGAGDRHGNRLTDSVAAVWVGVVGVGGGMADPHRRGVCGDEQERPVRCSARRE